MKSFYITILTILFFSCDYQLENVQSREDVIKSSQLSDLQALGAVKKGVVENGPVVTGAIIHWLAYVDDAGYLSSGFSDELFFDKSRKNSAATYPTFSEIDQGRILITNTSVATFFIRMSRGIGSAEELFKRINALKADLSDKNTKLVIDNAKYYANFLKAFGIYTNATMFSIDETSGKGVILESTLQSNSDMMAQSVELFKEALRYTKDANKIASVNTLIARVYLSQKDYTNAAVYATLGLKKGNAGLIAEYEADTDTENSWYFGAGAGRPQWTVSSYLVNASTKEDSLRIPIAGAVYQGKALPGFFMQSKYLEKGDNFPVATWQENELMLAELSVRNSNTSDALQRLNKLRKEYGLANLTSVDLSVIEDERRKELAFTGLRFMDQKRFGTTALPGEWRFLPIPEAERNSNPNL